MVLTTVAKTFSLEEQRQEINEIAVDLDAVNTTLTNWNATQWDTAYSWGDHAQAGYLVATSASYNNAEWDTAYGWGDHALAGYQSAISSSDSFSITGLTVSSDVKFLAGSNNISLTAPGSIAANYTLTLPDNDGTTSGQVLATDGSGTLSWVTRGNGDLVNGTLASTIYRGSGEFRLIAGGAQTTRPHIHLKNSTSADLDILGADSGSAGVNIDSRGTGTVKLKDGGNLKLETSDSGVTVTGVLTASGGTSDSWNLAYGWGDHALAGYTTTTYVDNAVINSGNWDAAFGWGDHSAAGYLTAEADTLNTVTGRGATTTNGITIGSLTTSGITISTQTDTGASGTTTVSDLFDHYEEGTWTPVYEGGGTFSCTYAQQAGHFTRIGRVVYVHGVISTASVSGTGSGPLKVAGLPFTVNNGRQPLSIRTIAWDQSSNDFSQTPQYATFEDGNDHFEILKGDVGGSTDYVASSMLGANNQNILHFSGFYTV